MRLWQVLILLASAVAGLYASPAADVSTLQDFTPFEVGEQGGILVLAKVNGAEPVRLLLDTGSTHSLISDDLARTIAAPVVANTTLASSIGEITSPVVRLDRMEIGPIVNVGLLPTVIRAERMGWADTIQGVIGQDVLAPLRYTIDFRNRRIAWHRHDGDLEARGSSFALESVQGRFLVALPQRDSTLRLVPDSGSGALVLFRYANRRLPPMAFTSGGAELTTLTGRRFVQQARVHELRIGSTTWRDVTAVLVERPAMEPSSDGAQTDGLLPLHLFDRVTFDGARGRLTVQ